MVALKDAFVFLESTLNQYLLMQFSLKEKIVELNHLVDLEGKPASKNLNKLVITLINLTQETAQQHAGARVAGGTSASVIHTNPTVRFNIDVMFTANFEDYSEALKFLNATIAFFQVNPVFNQSVFSDFPQELEKLTFEVEDSDYFATHNLWSAMGAKYQPSIIYKMRHISVQADQISAVSTAVNRTTSQATPQ